MPERKPFLLRLDAETMDAVRAWASDDLRSLNGQIEFVLRRALRDAGRLPQQRGRRPPPGASDGDSTGTAGATEAAAADGSERSDDAA